jgi:hypothetical protein
LGEESDGLLHAEDLLATISILDNATVENRPQWDRLRIGDGCRRNKDGTEGICVVETFGESPLWNLVLPFPE